MEDQTFENAQAVAIARKIRVHYVALLAEGFNSHDALVTAIAIVKERGWQ